MSQLHPVISKLRQLQRSEKKWLLVYSCSWFVTLLVVVWLTLGLVDFSWRTDLTWVRLGLSCTLLVAAGFGFSKLLWPAFGFRRNLVEVAKALEAQDPALKTRLSLAADFLSTDESQNGSPDLRAVTIQQAQKVLNAISPANQINRRKPLQAFSLALLSLLITGMLLISFPEEGLFAIRRTVMPTAPLPWPAYHNLQFKELPERIAIGDEMEVIVQDRRGRTPAIVVLEIDDERGRLLREMQTEQDRAVFVIRNIDQDFRIRASGGDGQTEWHPVSVVSPPMVNELVIDVLPPTYSGLARYSTAPFEKIWQGSAVEIRGRSDRDISGTRFLITDGKRPTKTSQLPIEVSPIARIQSESEFVYPATGDWVVNSTTEFRIELTDVDSVKGGKNRLFRIPVRIDNPPTVDLTLMDQTAQTPSLSPQQMVVAKDQPIQLQIRAADDMQVRSLSLLLKTKGNEPVSYAVPFQPLPAAVASDIDLNVIQTTFEFKLKDLPEIDPQRPIEACILVEDSFGHKTESPELSLRVGTADELRVVDQRRKNLIFRLIKKVLDKQVEAANLCGLILHSNPSDWTTKDESRLNRLADDQSEIESELFGRAGVFEKCETLLSSAQSRLSENLRGEIKNVQNILKPIRRVVRLASDQSAEAAVVVRQPDISLNCLTQVQTHQMKILDSLQVLVGQMDVQTRLASYLAELRTVLQQQETVRQLGFEIRTRLINNPDINPVEINRLAAEQAGVSNRLNELSWGLLNDSRQLNSNQLSILGKKAKFIEIESKAASDRIQRNQLGLAIEAMDKVILQLQKIFNQPENQFSTPSEASRDQLESAIKKLKSVLNLQDEIFKSINQWSESSAADQQETIRSLEALQQQLNEFAKLHEELLSENTRERLAEAGKLLDQMVQDLKKDQPEAAQNKMKQLRTLLSQVENELDATASELNRQIRQQRLRILQQSLEKWLQQQKEVKSLLDANQTTGQSLPQNILGLQTAITRDIRLIRQENSELFAIELELETLENSSIQVESTLAQGEIVKGIQLSRQIIEQLERLTQPAQKADPDSSQSEKGKQPSQETPAVDENSLRISEFEIQLLQRLQQEILDETQRLQSRKNDQLTPQEKSDLQAATLKLAQRQSQLVETLQKYLAPKSTASDSSDDSLPEIPEIPDLPQIESATPDLKEVREIPDLDAPLSDPCLISHFGSDDSDGKPGNLPDQQTGLQESVRERTTRQDKDSKVVDPFSSQGEDIGSDSDMMRNRLDSIRSKMQTVEKLLLEQELSAENQKLQKEIIKDFSLFMTDQQKQSREKSKQKKNQEKGKTGNDAATNSSMDPDQKQTGDQTSKSQEMIQKRFDKIWGTLPERMRSTGLNISADQILPKYRELIKEYFKRLANDPNIR